MKTKTIKITGINIDPSLVDKHLLDENVKLKNDLDKANAKIEKLHFQLEKVKNQNDLIKRLKYQLAEMCTTIGIDLEQSGKWYED